MKIVYSLPHKICRETYVKNFQYRILNYILYTNDWLYKFEITDSPLCPFCRNEVETIYHLFYYCTFVQSFWHQFESFLTEANNKISISFDQIFLGDIQITALPLKNYLILLGKIHIYTCRRNKVHPTLQGFLNIVKSKYLVERHLALNEGKVNSFENRWEMLGKGVGGFQLQQSNL